MRIAGLDVGSKTIGVALSDELLLTAQPAFVLARRGTTRDVERILDWCEEQEVAELVVGQPLELDGRIGHRARRVQVLVDALQGRFSGAVHVWDERMSTREAQRVLLEADLSRRKRKLTVDKVAAAIILQGYLDWRHGGAQALDQPPKESER
ncbi:MAG: Holliday junction resolvase RuvX [bacterium]